jgi:hypothetical protein
MKSKMLDKNMNTFLVEKKKEKPSNKESDKSKENNTKPEQMSDEEKKNKILEFIKQAAASGSDAMIASTLDNLTLGNFREALCDIFKDKFLKGKSEAEIQDINKKLTELPAYKKAEKYQANDNRKDENTSTDIDESSVKCNAMFYSNKKDDNIVDILKKLSVDIQKQAHENQKALEDTKAKVKKLGLANVTDSEVDAFGPIIAKMIADGKSKEEISKEVDKLKGEIKESFDNRIREFKYKKVLTEGNIVITETQKNYLMLESIVSQDKYIDAITYQLLQEGFFDTVKGLTKTAIKGGKAAIKGAAGLTKAAYGKLPEKFRNKIASIKDAVLEKIRDGALAPILKIAGITTMVLTGAWGIGLLIAVLMLIDRYGKQLKAAFEKQWTRFANSKGVITQMDFAIKDKPDLKYSARFYVKDMTWRVLNVSNQLKHQTKDFAKAILTSDIAKKYIDKVNKIWDPVFGKQDNGKPIDFATLLSSSKEVKFNDKQIKLLTDFQSQYDTIKSALNKPQIDTRDQSMKDAVKA